MFLNNNILCTSIGATNFQQNKLKYTHLKDNCPSALFHVEQQEVIKKLKLQQFTFQHNIFGCFVDFSVGHPFLRDSERVLINSHPECTVRTVCQVISFIRMAAWHLQQANIALRLDPTQTLSSFWMHNEHKMLRFWMSISPFNTYDQ